MEKPIDVIEQIKKDAGELQKKLLTIPKTESGGYSKEQNEALIDAQDGLSFWRRTHLVFLEKAFREES